VLFRSFGECLECQPKLTRLGSKPVPGRGTSGCPAVRFPGPLEDDAELDQGIKVVVQRPISHFDPFREMSCSHLTHFTHGDQNAEPDRIDNTSQPAPLAQNVPYLTCRERLAA